MKCASLTALCCAALLVSTLGGCRCDREAHIPKAASQSEKPLRQPEDRRLADRRQMKRVAMFAGELQRRVKHGGKGAEPALNLVTKLVRELPPDDRGDAFAQLQAQFVQRAGVLAKSEPSEMTAAYNQLIDSCTACHRSYGSDFVHKAEALRLP